jgi:hypothetical protein
VRAEILTTLWPHLEHNLLPILHQSTQPDGPFPLSGWPAPLPAAALGDAATSSSDPLLPPSLRISDMFVRRYARPPRGSPGRRDRSLHRWSIPQHQVGVFMW